ncbi:MAG TPA: long-chain fatty acid--CoA ligase [Rhodocyclaceae bacterium]|nr:long-chain fatty acid--CoA ligase [Rhodocyclaceae bacterium]
MQVVDWVAKQASLKPNKTALIDLGSGREVTYRELNDRVSRVASIIKSWQVTPGSRVAVLAHNSIEYLEWLYGCARAQTIMVCLNWRLSVDELTGVLGDATPKALVYGPEFAAQAETLGKMPGITATLSLDQAYEDALAEAEPGPANWGWRDEGEPWYLLYTSGSTGKPKGVIQTFGMCFLNAVNDMLGAGINSEDVFLSVLPFFHTGGLNLYCNPILMVGGTTYIMRQFDPGQTLDLIENKINVFFGVPAIYLFLSQHPRFPEVNLSKIRSWGAGGSPMPKAQLEEWLARGVHIGFGFGMTETGPTVFLTDPMLAERKIGTVGKPIGMMQCKIVDDSGAEVGPNTRGEVMVRGSGVTPGYWQMPEATAKAFTDGWLHTGDIGYYDDEGDFYIVDRVKDMFISGGENVYPAEVENVLAQMPEIAENGVIGVPDDKWVEVGKAIIALKPGATLTVDQVKAHCKAKLASYKVPKHIEFVPALPRNATGKIDKPRLRDQFGK